MALYKGGIRPYTIFHNYSLKWDGSACQRVYTRGWQVVVQNLRKVFAFITMRLHDPSMTRMLFSYPNISGYLIITLFLWHAFYIRNRHISVSSFVYKYDQWPHDSYMTGRAGAWEADDIVQFYIDLLDFFPATL
jgi:hypothetical protein